MAADDFDDDVLDDGEESPQKEKKGGMLVPILFGLVLAMSLGIGAAVAVIAGVAPIPGLTQEDGETDDEAAAEKEEEEAPVEDPVAFVQLEVLELTVGRADFEARIRLGLSIETSAAYAAHVEEMKPRILDALNTLLRATDPRDLAEPRALARLRAQMLRRIRLATDPTAIRNLLITEYFVY